MKGLIDLLRRRRAGAADRALRNNHASAHEDAARAAANQQATEHRSVPTW